MVPRVHIDITGTGQPLVMLHGWGWHSGIWQPLVPILSQYYQLFLVDLPGFGQSTLQLTDHTIENMAEAILPHVPDQATWLGWSLGGLVAWWTAAHHPKKINRLITVASTPRFVSDVNWPGLAPATLEKFSASLIDHYENTLLDFLELQLRGTAKQDALFSTLKNQMLSENKPQKSALLGGLKILRDTDLRNDSFSCPSLHIFGSLDTIVPASVATHVQSLLTDGRCEIIARTGHLPFLSPDFLKHLPF